MHPLEHVRAYYLSCLTESFDKCRAECESCALEVMLEIPREGETETIYRLYRADILLTIGGSTKVREVNVTPKEVEAPSSRLRENARIVVPVVWNSLEFRVTSRGIPDAPIIDWAKHWLDVDDSRYDDTSLYQEVAHNILRPLPRDHGYTLTVDFGSAPVLAFDQLLDILVADAGNIEIGSFQYANQF